MFEGLVDQICSILVLHVDIGEMQLTSYICIVINPAFSRYIPRRSVDLESVLSRPDLRSGTKPNNNRQRDCDCCCF